MKKKETENIIGIKEIVKDIKAGQIKKVIVAKNCPDFLIERIQKAGKVEIEKYEGDQIQLATKLGKPFPIAVVGVK